jgi:hypothetical protein
VQSAYRLVVLEYRNQPVELPNLAPMRAVNGLARLLNRIIVINGF